jgi:hypothetical protein
MIALFCKVSQQNKEKSFFGIKYHLMNFHRVEQSITFNDLTERQYCLGHKTVISLVTLTYIKMCFFTSINAASSQEAEVLEGKGLDTVRSKRE